MSERKKKKKNFKITGESKFSRNNLDRTFLILRYETELLLLKLLRIPNEMKTVHIKRELTYTH